ncbi:hypothetical protein FCL54_17105 [Pseudalkalibacillus caeni]|uniref:Staygreen protein domain-containing protein n=2 Tax=Exobacillus caeni TaxID=2574798 RepID=A0A5R9F8W3_9BACL|nr:hypothetical protein FCL54_17105 [Pseudalkalibacillus caeni]
MHEFDPAKLTVEFRSGVSLESPLAGRKYTLTHSDQTGQLFLTIAPYFAEDKIDKKSRDEVLAEWCILNGKFVLFCYCYIGGVEMGETAAALRFDIFQKELPLALKAIRYGDSGLFLSNPELDFATILIRFESAFPQYRMVQYWGQPADYR